ncbi:hypothetical protein AX17_003046 [Amanita inopinata Kibby_2008]|nr:hypothetical protein AX17_003046 [Amanita inopinata Kibby_2008]
MSVSVATMIPNDIHRQHLSLSIHRGALDQTMVTTQPPPQVMERVRQVLTEMGVSVQVESEFKYRCICRLRRPEAASAMYQELADSQTLAFSRLLIPIEDATDEVRFSVELTRLDGLHSTYSLDVRRLKGNLRSYKLLYDTLRIRADLYH